MSGFEYAYTCVLIASKVGPDLNLSFFPLRARTHVNPDLFLFLFSPGLLSQLFIRFDITITTTPYLYCTVNSWSGGDAKMSCRPFGPSLSTDRILGERRSTPPRNFRTGKKRDVSPWSGVGYCCCFTTFEQYRYTTSTSCCLSGRSAFPSLKMVNLGAKKNRAILTERGLKSQFD